MAELRKYYYTAKNEKGKIERGELRSVNLEEAQKAVEGKGLIPLSVEEESRFEFNFSSIFSRVPAGDKALFSRQIATMVGAGYNLSDALKVISSQTKNMRLREVITEISADVESGYSLSTAMAKHRDIFNRVYIAVVRSGEASGKLPTILEDMATEIERAYDFAMKLRNALLYPAFIFCALIIVGALMMIKVIPQLKSIFDSSKVELPWTTKAVIAVAGFLTGYWWLVLFLIIIIYFLFRVYI